jgi:YfiH family protein
VEVVRVPEWEPLEWLWHGFSTRTAERRRHTAAGKRPGRDLNLGFTASDPEETVIANRRRFLEAVAGLGSLRNQSSLERKPAGSPGLPGLATLKQIHSSLMWRVGKPAGDSVAARAVLSGDGQMTDDLGVLLGIVTADCIPVLVADRRKRAVAAFHAGWRGTVKRIVEQGVGRMRLEFGSRPEDLVAAIGPGVGQCCYAVGEEVRSEFECQFRYAVELFREVSDRDPVREKYPMLFLTALAPGHGPQGLKLHLDLVEANRRQLLDAGLRRGRCRW